jgi:CDP-glucose 4,6-dehydratase
MFGDFYRNKTVLVTGHTGFKGAWLCEWLLSLGADVIGYALDPEPHELLYEQLGLHKRLKADYRADLADRELLAKVVAESEADVILHLAAQPLVRLSYDIPVETFATNVMGTANLLDAVRVSGHACSVVCVTTDKCYENKEWLHAYREEDAMGGHDPYSASKGAAEIVISSYRRSFFKSGKVRLASARAGNVIGGGDWAVDRIVPDCIRAIRGGESIPVRNKIASRPWQHVLEPLSGYLKLASDMARVSIEDPRRQTLSGAFNFGPNLSSNRTVAELVIELIENIGGEWIDASDPGALHEASKLNLAIDKAFHLLKWKPILSFEDTLKMTADWYQAEMSGELLRKLTQNQILSFQNTARIIGLEWAEKTKIISSDTEL